MYCTDGLGDGVWHRHRTRLDLARYLVDLGLNVGGDVDIALGEADAVVRQAEGRDAGLEAAIVDALDRVVGRGVHTLDRAGDDRRRGRALVGVNADAVDALVLRRGQHAQAAAAGYLEDHVRAA